MTPAPANIARLGIVLVNYKRVDDSIECLESVLRSTIPVRIVVVDNQSNDGSPEAIAAWAAGTRPATPASPDMARFSRPCRKPLPIARLTAAEAAATDPSAIISVIDAGSNGGFAAGNNIGIRHLLRDPAIDHIWLLNNDTVVDPGAAEALLSHLDATRNVGLCGTIVRFYWRPDTIQALNGHRFNPFTGTSRGIGAGQPATTNFDPKKIAAETDFVLGASLAASRAFLETIGPMEEGYFLYFEEVDWAARGGNRFVIGFAQGAIVYHKEGGSIGSSATAGARSGFSDYWLNRSRLRFIRRHRPWLLPLHWLVTLATIARRLGRGQLGKAMAITRALVGMAY